MIKATELHGSFRRVINRINSAYLKSISVVDVDGFLTDAYYTIYENLVIKAEVNSLAEDRIRQKLVRGHPLTPVKNDSNSTKVTYPDDTYRVLRRYAKACREGCDSRTLTVHISQSSDLNESLKDTFWSPSWEWEETLGIQDSNGLIVFDNCDFETKEVVIDYFTKPRPIKCPSLVRDDCYRVTNGQYIDVNGNTVSADSDFELDTTDLWLKVANLAAAKALMNSGAIGDYRTMMESVLADEKIFL